MQTLRHLKHNLQYRPRLAIAAALGLAVALLTPGDWHVVTRALTGWNTSVWFYLIAMTWLMARADHGHLLRFARAQADSAPVVLSVVITATLASLVAIAMELSWIKQNGMDLAAPHVLLAAGTVLGAWLLVPMEFTLSYAACYHAEKPPAGLRFPETDASFSPNYSDLLYFAFTIAVAAQTADVAITTRAMRRVVLLQSVLSFAFNTAVLALTVNIAAGLL
ncbi:MAG TPA: DUF1345 domain-containing protein [Ideonella sp.]|uniref:DUF1345 domain-containing protein n=1 Tax=Ideonella sp. TaxID=1929293 RepID=UPI002BB0CD89|nr:DUF1345 domain-containing protein [Ideonella sp.]HSI52199.1 DUF1345 domain-containing protein [Ideonella sp.]